MLTGFDTKRVPRQFAGLFHGEVDVSEHGPLGPLSGDTRVDLSHSTFDDEFGEICDTYLLLGYCADQPRGCGAGIGTCAGCREGSYHDH